MPTRRNETLGTLCRRNTDKEHDLDIALVAALKAAGPSTVAIVSVRGAGKTVTFPLKNSGLKRAWNVLPGSTDKLEDHLLNWNPRSACTANLLWRSLGV